MFLQSPIDQKKGVFVIVAAASNMPLSMKKVMKKSMKNAAKAAPAAIEDKNQNSARKTERTRNKKFRKALSLMAKDSEPVSIYDSLSKKQKTDYMQPVP